MRAAVTLTSEALTGANAGDYAISFNNCAASLAAGSQCQVQVTFSPTANGARTASLTVTDNANGSPQSVAISGTGQTSTFILSFSPASLTFAAQNTGTTSGGQNIFITNTGNAAVTLTSEALTGANAGDYAISFNNCGASLPAGNQCQVQVTFSPTAVGARTASLTVTDNANGSPQSVPISGTGQTSTFLLSFSPASLTFAAQNTGSTSVGQNIFITNTGNAAVTLTSEALTGANAGDYAISFNNCAASLTAGSQCFVQITFSPTAVGARTASLTVTDNANGSPQSVPLSGTGQTPTFILSFSPVSLTFAAQNTGTTSGGQNINISNTGNAAVTLTSELLTGANAGDYAISFNNCAASLTSGSSCIAQITFSPTAVGARTASLTVTDNATGSPQSVPISGTGQTATRILSFSPASLTFAAQNTGTTSGGQNINISNTGNAAVTLTSEVLTGANAGDYAISFNNCPASLTSGSSCIAQITFSPTAVGARTASLTVTDNANGSPQSVPISGTGQTSTFLLSFSPASLTFAAQNTGSTSGGQNINISNTGNAAVTLTSELLTGANAGDYAISFNNCPASLASGSSCIAQITFSPTAVGARTASLTVTDNANGSPQSVPISGTGQTPTFLLSFSPVSLTFAAQNTGTTSGGQNIFITNTGNAAVTLTSELLTGANAGDYAISFNNCAASLPAGNQCQVQITFSPTAVGARTASLTVTDNATGSPQSVPISGTGQTPTRILSFNPASLTFALQNTGSTSAAQGVTVTNTGNSPMAFTAIAIAGANASDFAQSVNTCPISPTTLAAGGSCTVSVTFSPGAAGARSASISFTDNANGSPQSVSLTGTGQVPVFTLSFSPTSLTFAAQNTGTTSTAQGVTISNTGNSPITFTSFVLGGANAGDYAISFNNCPINPATLPAGNACSINATFSPSAVGSRTASIAVTDNATGSPQSISLTGTGRTPVKSLSFSPSPVTFGTVNTGSNSAVSLTVTSSGNTAVTLTSIAISGVNAADYSITSNNCPSSPATLAAGNACSVQITFAPSAAGTRTASINFTDDAVGSPQSVAISGIGQVLTFTLSFSPSSLTFAAQNLGTSSAAQGVTVSNTGNSAITFSGFVLTGANPAEYSISANSCPSSPATLAASNNCSFSIVFTPSAAGTRTASVSITDTATGSPQTVGLSGTGQVTNKTLSFSPPSLTFPTTTTGNSSAAQNVSVVSTGTAAVTFSSFAVAGTNAGDYSFGVNSCPVAPATLAPGVGCSFTVVFTPGAAGTRTASVTVADDATGSPQSVGLTGTGQAPATTITFNPPSITDPTPVTIGSNTGLTYNTYIRNTGTSPVLFNSFALGGANPGDFAISENLCPQPPNTLAAGGTCYIYVTFAPTLAGTRTATLIVTDNATGTPQSVTVTGTGQAAVTTLTITPSTYTFPTTQTVGTTSAQTNFATLNTGTLPVTFSSIQIAGTNAGDFAMTPSTNCSTISQLTVGNTCQVYVSFTPTAAGTRTATLVYTDNATGSPQSVALTGTGAAPTLTLTFSQTSLSYSTIAVGASQNLSFNITNTGNAPVNLTGYTITGTNPGDFSIYFNNCPATLTVNGACTVGVTFAPTAIGARAAALQIADNATGNPQSIPLTGTGSSAVPLVVTPTTLTFAPQNLTTTSAGLNVNVNNTSATPVTITSAAISGANAADFNLSADTCPMSPSTLGATTICAITVTFTPSAAGARTATLTLTDSASNSPQTVTLSGTGQTNSQLLRLYSTSIVFPSTPLNSTTAPTGYYVELYNAGTGAITLGGANISGTNAADFAISQNTCPVTPATLTAGGACFIYVTFSPQAVGSRTGALNISSNALGSPQTVTLLGTGASNTNQMELNFTGLSFAAQLVGTTAAQQGVNVYNTGNSPVSISSIALTGANAADYAFTIQNCPVAPQTLAGGGSCSVYVNFTPSAVGTRTASIQFTDNSTGSPQTVTLNGSGKSSSNNLSLSSNGITFPSTLQGSTSPQEFFYIYNVGTAPSTISGLTLVGPNAADFAINQNECPMNPVAIPADCYIYLTFTPSVVGAETASLQIADNSPGSPQVVELNGIGLTHTSAIQISSTTSLIFPTLTVGTTSALNGYYFYITNVGTDPITINSFTIVGTNSGDFTLGTTVCPSAPSTLAPGANCYQYVRFTPTAVGPRTASVQVIDSAPDSPQSVNLLGTGQPAEQLIDIRSSSITFPVQGIGTTSGATANYFYIYNLGTAPVTVNSISITGANAADFAIPSTICPISPATIVVNGNCYVYVTFTPSMVGPEYATVQITDSVTGSPQTVYLTGTGQTATEFLRFDPAPFIFPATTLGSSSGQVGMQIYNEGTAPATFSSYTLTGGNASDFSISLNQCPSGATALAPLAACEIYVTFTPSAAGQRTTTLQITDTASGSPQSIPVVGNASTPVFYSNVTQVAFGPQNIGTTAPASAWNIYNEGTGATPLTFSNFAITGTNAADFALSFNNCTGLSLTTGEACTLSATFTPSIVGVETAAVQITDDASGSPHLINLVGIGQAATSNALTLSRTELTFAPQNASTTSPAQVFNIYNYGTSPITFTGISLAGANASDFGISFNNCGTTLAPNGSGCTVELTFTPTAAGPRSATVQVASSAAGSPETLSLFGTGQPAYESLFLSVDTLSFTPINVGSTSGALSFNIYNYGDSVATFAATNPFTIAGPNSGDFNISFNNCGTTLAPGGNVCTVQATFRPSALGVRTATLQVADDAPGSPQSVNLIGTGQPVTDSITLTQTTLEFNLVNQGVPSPEQQVNIYNYGTAPVNLTSETISGANAGDFSISFNNCSSSLGANGAVCSLQVIFTPSTTSAETATLQIVDGAADSPQVITLLGTGQAPAQTLVFNVSSYTFAPQNIGTSSAQNGFSLYNYGTAPVSLTNFSIGGANTGDFAITFNNCPTTLGVGAGCTVYATFTPTAVGARSATVVMTDSATGSPQSVSLFGTGATPVQAVMFYESNVVFGPTTVGTTTTVLTNNIYNVGNAPVSLTGYNLTGTNSTEFAITLNNCPATLGVGGVCTVEFTFTPAATGLRTANLQVTDTATGSPQIMNLFGTGQ